MADNLDDLTKRLIDEGKIIEAGFIGLKDMAFPGAILPPDQDRELRMAFFAGAQHLFASIMTMMDDDDEPTDADMRRMDSIRDELHEFIASVDVQTEGNA